MSSPPAISILIPCFNAERWLAPTLESALGQTHRSTEIILVDDGSRDNSLAIARQFEARGVRVVSQPNRGAGAARNHGLQLARGEFIQFLDADDLLAPDKISEQHARLAQSPDCVASGPWARFENDPTTATFVPEENWRDCEPIEWLALNFAGRGMMPPASWLTPRALLDRAGPWDERLSLNDDGEYFCRVLLAAREAKFCAGARTFYRSNFAGSVSWRRSIEAWQSAVLSHELCTQHLLSKENSLRSRRACADLFQRLAFAMYPDCPDLVVRCEDEARKLGGSALRPGGGVLFQLLRRLVGWKSARRWQRRRQAAATGP